MKSLKTFLIIFISLAKSTYSLVPFHRTCKIDDLILQKNHEFYKNYDNLGEYKKYFEPNMFSELDKYNTFDLSKLGEDAKINIGNTVVKKLSSFLPHVDNIGHNILHANNLFINDILNSDYLSHDLQRQIILTSIKLAQQGDNFGSDLLQIYYNIVNYFL